MLRSLVSVDMEFQEKHIPEAKNIDDTLELLPELLDKSTELEPLMDLEEIDSHANTNDLNTVGYIFEKLKNGEIDLNSVCSNKRVPDNLNPTKKNSQIQNSGVMVDVSRYNSYSQTVYQSRKGRERGPPPMLYVINAYILNSMRT